MRIPPARSARSPVPRRERRQPVHGFACLDDKNRRGVCGRVRQAVERPFQEKAIRRAPHELPQLEGRIRF
jgi:hypothetical protein